MKQYIYGKNPIMEALKGASVYKIYMLNGHKDPKIFDISLRTSIIVGFPGETDEQFEELCDFVKEIKFH